MATFAKPENALKRAEGRSFDLCHTNMLIVVLKFCDLMLPFKVYLFIMIVCLILLPVQHICEFRFKVYVS